MNNKYLMNSSHNSVKWSDPVHFLKSQGKFFFVISMYPFYIFVTPTNYKSSP